MVRRILCSPALSLAEQAKLRRAFDRLWPYVEVRLDYLPEHELDARAAKLAACLLLLGAQQTHPEDGIDALGIHLLFESELIHSSDRVVSVSQLSMKSAAKLQAIPPAYRA